MRILFTVHGYKPAWRIGGPIISVSSVAESLVRRGHEVIVLTSNSNLDEDLDVPTDCPVDVEGVQVWYFKRREPLKRLFPRVAYVSKSLGFLYTPKMARALDRMVPGVDVVHTHLPFIYPTYAAAHAAFRHGKPLFYHQRGGFDPERLKFRSLKKTLYLRMIEISILKRATTLIALTEAEAVNYQRLGVGTPCRVIPNGIDTAAYTVSRDRILLETIGIGERHTVILFMGRIHPIKGADRLVDAFLMVKQEFPEALLVFAGPDEFGLEASLWRRVDGAGLSGSVIFPGMVHGALKKQLLARADLFCLPSAAEGFSMAVLEALASSTAVLLSPGCHFPEVEQKGAGRIVEADTGLLAGELRELLADRSGLARMGKLGRQLVTERYTWKWVTTQLVEAYEEGISRHTVSLNGR
jgi:glycosyltransferase involved in cell wall biosynthesis